MKKVSVSLVAILAITLAVGSAFTTKNVKVAQQGWHFSLVEQLPNDANVGPEDFDINAAPITKPTQGSYPCTTSSSYVCAAYVNASGVIVNDPNGDQLIFGSYEP